MQANAMAGETLVGEAGKSETAAAGQSSARGRILKAAFYVLMEHGYAGATTREIAARAKVSKRELYASFGSKQGILAALIEERSNQMRMPLAASANLRTRAELASVLTRYGANLLHEVFQPAPLAMHRLALAESERSPEMARILDEGGRNANLRSMIAFLATAKHRGLLPDVEPEAMAGRFFTLLWGDRLLRVLMRVTEMPQTDEIKTRAEAATADFLALYPAPQSEATSDKT
jgi:AcrR family transcriptional regulator